MTTLDRRRFLRGAALAAGGLSLAAPLSALGAREAAAGPGRSRSTRGSALLAPDNGGYGPLVENGADIALPAGFSLVAFGRSREPMTDGRLTPNAHDGMAAFPGPDGTVRLVRNHEVGENPPIDALNSYDLAAGGGTVTLDFDPESRTLVRSFASLSGTSATARAVRPPGAAGSPARRRPPPGRAWRAPASCSATTATSSRWTPPATARSSPSP